MKKIILLLLGSFPIFGQSTTAEIQGISQSSFSKQTTFRSTAFISSNIHSKTKNSGICIFSLATISPIQKNGVYSAEFVIGKYFHSPVSIKNKISHEGGFYVGAEYLSHTNVRIGPRFATYYSGYYLLKKKEFPKITWLILTEYGPVTGTWYLGQLMVNTSENFEYGIHAQKNQCIGPRIQCGGATKISFTSGINIESRQFGFFIGLRRIFNHSQKSRRFLTNTCPNF